MAALIVILRISWQALLIMNFVFLGIICCIVLVYLGQYLFHLWEIRTFRQVF